MKATCVQDCCQYHQAKDGDGWVEYKGSLVFNRPQKVFNFTVILVLLKDSCEVVLSLVHLPVQLMCSAWKFGIIVFFIMGSQSKANILIACYTCDLGHKFEPCTMH